MVSLASLSHGVLLDGGLRIGCAGKNIGHENNVRDEGKGMESLRIFCGPVVKHGLVRSDMRGRPLSAGKNPPKSPSESLGVICCEQDNRSSSTRWTPPPRKAGDLPAERQSHVVQSFSGRAQVMAGGSCAACKGKKAIDCPGCKGSGRNKKNGNMFERWKCYDCQGFGLVSCPTCSKGKGLTPEQRRER
eukprot:TRINITY_DN12214_c0_g7_i1.p1 TRINITY_DN12214_c0_g7~~TRINITY_DN12214_c0_g7_i1.p1  ORF type:complete len:199 (-),score=12.95 TRINITY_DN12214_c0_g7_i1:236-802(-)